MYIIYVNHDSVIKQICQLRDKAFLINETTTRLLYWVEENNYKMTLRKLFEAQIAIIRIARPFRTPAASAQNRRS